MANNKKKGGVKEFFRKKIVTLKRKPQMIPLLVLAVGFLVYSLNLTHVSDTTAKIQLAGLGMNTLVHGRLNGVNAADAAITCKLRGWSDYKAGDRVMVKFEKRHFFDKETTNAIR